MSNGDYKAMGVFLGEDQELRSYLAANHCRIEGKNITVIAERSAFRVLADLKARGYRFYAPAGLAQSWGITRQAVNNVINRGLLVTIEYKGGFTFDYKYVVFESVEAQGERRARADKKTLAQVFATDQEPDAAGWVQDDFSAVVEEPGAPLPSPPPLADRRAELEERKGLRDELLNCLRYKREYQGRKVTRAELYREFPGEVPTVEELRKKGYKPGEIKILRAGFSLVRYDREGKKVVKTCEDPRLGWYGAGVLPTYAAAERRRDELLQDHWVVEVNADGRTFESKTEAKLRAEGFSFYRNAGMDYDEKSGRIKIGPSWKTYKKVATKKELAAAWAELMKDEKALEG